MQRIHQPSLRHPTSPALQLSVGRVLTKDDIPTTYPILDADPYIPGGNGAQWYINQSNLQVSVECTFAFSANSPAQLSISEELRHRSSTVGLFPVAVQPVNHNLTGSRLRQAALASIGNYRKQRR